MRTQVDVCTCVSREGRAVRGKMSTSTLAIDRWAPASGCPLTAELALPVAGVLDVADETTGCVVETLYIAVHREVHTDQRTSSLPRSERG